MKIIRDCRGHFRNFNNCYRAFNWILVTSAIPVQRSRLETITLTETKQNIYDITLLLVSAGKRATSFGLPRNFFLCVEVFSHLM